MHEEYMALKKNNTWYLVPFGVGKMYRLQMGLQSEGTCANSSADLYKAHLVEKALRNI
jgi:hypothetical protein